jgi:predicted phosphodiesterase
MTPISDDAARRAAELYKLHGSERAAARAAGMPKTNFHLRLTRAAERGFLGTEPVLPGYEIKRTTAQYDAAGNLKGEFVTQHKESGVAFEMPEGQVLKGVSAYVDAEGRVRAKWIKTRGDTVTADLVAVLKDVFAAYRGRAKPVPAPRAVDRNLMSVYPIADQHNGLLAWGRQTGESYDLAIGERRLLTTSAELIAQSPRAARALILNLGDWQHTDDQRNMTPRSGHLLDVDGRYYKILAAGVRMMMSVIELALARHQHVLVRNIPGNHDPHASIALTIALKAFYHNNRRVTIDDDPSDWFFHRFGSTLIGATHGHNVKPERMAMTMASRQRVAWGATRYHWMLFGHIHHETAKEVGDVRCESFQTLAAKDAYAHAAGFNSGQSLVSVTLHRTRGEIGRHRVNI